MTAEEIKSKSSRRFGKRGATLAVVVQTEMQVFCGLIFSLGLALINAGSFFNILSLTRERFRPFGENNRNSSLLFLFVPLCHAICNRIFSYSVCLVWLNYKR